MAIGSLLGALKSAISKNSSTKLSNKGLSGTKSNASFNSNTDYSQAFNNALYTGASQEQLKNIYNSWNSKVQNPSYSKWDTPEQRSYMESMINASGSGLAGKDYDYNDYYSQTEDLLREQYEAQQRAIQEGINNAVAQNESYIPKVNKDFESAVNSAYVTRELNKANAGEALSAMGMTGGASESALLGMNTGFENSRNEATRSRDSTINDIYQNSANIRSTGNTNLATLGADYSGKLAQALQLAQQQADERSNFDKQFDFSNKQFNVGNNQWKQQFDTANNQWKQQFDRDTVWGDRDYALQKAATDYSTGKPYATSSSPGGGYRSVNSNSTVSGNGQSVDPNKEIITMLGNQNSGVGKYDARTAFAVLAKLNPEARARTLNSFISMGRIDQEQAREAAKLLGL